jgi:hypothetical protein
VARDLGRGGRICYLPQSTGLSVTDVDRRLVDPRRPSLTLDPTVLLTSSGVIAVYAATTGGTIEGVSQAVAYGPFGTWTEIT